MPLPTELGVWLTSVTRRHVHQWQSEQQLHFSRGFSLKSLLHAEKQNVIAARRTSKNGIPARNVHIYFRFGGPPSVGWSWMINRQIPSPV